MDDIKAKIASGGHQIVDNMLLKAALDVWEKSGVVRHCENNVSGFPACEKSVKKLKVSF